MMLRKRYENAFNGYISLEKIFGRYIYTYQSYNDAGKTSLIEHFEEPLLAHVSITDKCNLNCQYCYANDGSHMKDMGLSEFKYILDKLDKAGILSIILTGGEPLLHPNINEILDYSIRKKITVLLLTNLSMIDTLDLELLKTPYFAFQISLNGVWDNERQNNKELMKTVNNYMKIKELKIPIIVTIVIDNVKINLESLFKFLENYEITSVRFGLLINLGRNKQTEGINNYIKYVQEATYKIAEYKKQHPNLFFTVQTEYVEYMDPYIARRAVLCEAGISELFVDKNGDVFPCPLFKSFKDFFCGNILNDSVSEIWNSHVMDKMRKISLEQMGCNSCNNRCGVWCRGLVYSYENSLDKKSPFCIKNF